MNDIIVRAIKALRTSQNVAEESLNVLDANTCRHTTTERQGSIWEACCDCSARWADDRGGRPASGGHDGGRIDTLRASLDEVTSKEVDAIIAEMEGWDLDAETARADAAETKLASFIEHSQRRMLDDVDGDGGTTVITTTALQSIKDDKDAAEAKVCELRSGILAIMNNRAGFVVGGMLFLANAMQRLLDQTADSTADIRAKWCPVSERDDALAAVARIEAGLGIVSAGTYAQRARDLEAAREKVKEAVRERDVVRREQDAYQSTANAIIAFCYRRSTLLGSSEVEAAVKSFAIDMQTAESQRDDALRCIEEIVRHLDDEDGSMGIDFEPIDLKETPSSDIVTAVVKRVEGLCDWTRRYVMGEDVRGDASSEDEKARKHVAKWRKNLDDIRLSLPPHNLAFDGDNEPRLVALSIERLQRERDEVGVQLVAAQAEVERLRPLVVTARIAIKGLSHSLAALDAVPGDALGTPFDESATTNPDKKGGE